MNIFRLLFELFLIYIAYKLVFELIIPVYKTTRQVKEKMSEMHRKMEEQQQQQAYQENSRASTSSKSSVAGDYIEYEEIK